jgi:hypothetical protein
VQANVPEPGLLNRPDALLIAERSTYAADGKGGAFRIAVTVAVGYRSPSDLLTFTGLRFEGAGDAQTSRPVLIRTRLSPLCFADFSIFFEVNADTMLVLCRS